MAWIYLAELGESHKPWLLGCGQSPIVSESDTLKPSFFQEWSAEKSIQPQSGMMSQPCGEICSQESTSSAVDSPARTCPSPDLEVAWQESEAAYFSKSCGLHASYSPDSCSWRMSQESLPGIALEPLVERWPRWAMIVGGDIFQLMPWAHISQGGVGSLWPAPTASDFKGGRIRAAAERSGRKETNNLRDFLRQRFNLKRPHPILLEKMMGYHIGTTETTPLATEWFRNKSKKRSKDLRG